MRMDAFSADLRSVCPGLWEGFDAALANKSSLRRATDTFVVLYGVQNRMIHQEISMKHPRFSLAKCELRWIIAGGPDRFFKQVSCFRPEIFQEDLYGAFNAFQALLLTLHFRHLKWILGRDPTQNELFSEEWFRWAGRLRLRFSPILP